MSTEGRILKAVSEQEGGETGAASHAAARYQRLQQKNKVVVDRFLGNGQRAHEVAIMPRYYGELLTWALERYREKEGWEVVQTLGYHSRQPVYIDVNTNSDHRENLLRDGQMLLERETNHLIVTVDINLQWRNSILVEGTARKKKEVMRFINGVLTIAQEQNFYRGKKIEFAGRLRFLDLKERSWDSIIIEEEIKKEIKANTIAFLGRRELWDRYGMPPRRGILLAGEPGTGKTIICKALMAEADSITCIAASAYALDADEYITELYELAQDLSPCLVFIEDIDLIGQNREEFGYQKGAALMSLLAVMDGIEKKKEIVTIATTNCLDTLDKALSERPSRFDRVIKLSHPSWEQRRQIIHCLCQKIPLDEPTQVYIAHQAENCTPAQLQEIIYSLVIQHPLEEGKLEFSRDEVDHTISKINRQNRCRIGFNPGRNHHGDKSELSTTIKLN